MSRPSSPPAGGPPRAQGVGGTGLLAQPLARYALAVSLCGVALAARFALRPVLPSLGFPFLTFFPAVLLSAYLAGLGPGLVAAALSIACAWLFFIGSPGQFEALSVSDAVALVFFSLVLLVDCVVIHVMNLSLLRVRQAERQLRETEHRLRLVLDRLPVAVSLVDLDGTRREVNEASVIVAGGQRDELLGRKFWEAPWWAADPRRQAEVCEAIGRAGQGRTVRFDAVLPLVQGEQRTISFEVAPLREADGRISGLVTCGVDVTDRSRALADLERSRADAVAAAAAAERERRVLDATFNAVPAGIIVGDAQGRLVRMNRAVERIWGIAPYSGNVDEYRDWKGWWAGDSPRAGQRIEPHEWGLARSLQGEECTDLVEIEPFGYPGRRLVTLLSSAPVLDPTGQVVGGVVVQVDVTDRVKAEQALREADRHKDTFLATLSHELRNPLAPIRSAAHVIRLAPQADPRARNAAEVIERQSAQLARLVDDLLDVSRLNIDNLRLQRQVVDLRAVVEVALETTRPRVQAAGHALEVHLAPEPLPADVDASRIAQCVANLVDNAAKFTPAPGHIEVWAEGQPDGWAAVRVRDNGAGIAPDMLARVFELFAQDRRGDRERNTGLGIGLSLTRRLVELHGGQVLARSEGEGRGAEFEIRLPLRHAEAAGARGPAQVPASGPGAAESAPAVRPMPLVLVVDDNLDAADTLKLLLEMQGLEVLTAADGAGALAAARARRPPVVVLDIGLPDMSGYEVAQHLREDPGWPRRPLLIALTGWGQARDRERAAQAGFDHHFTKPADPERLAVLVREHLQMESLPA